MIELILIAGGSLIVAMLSVWLYRRITEMKGSNVSLSVAERTPSLKLSRQQGYVHIRRPSKASRARIGLATNHPSAKPWGW